MPKHKNRHSRKNPRNIGRWKETRLFRRRGTYKSLPHVLRRTHFGVGFVHGPKRGASTEKHGTERQNRFMHHSSTFLGSVHHVWQDTSFVWRTDCVFGQYGGSWRVLCPVSTAGIQNYWRLLYAFTNECTISTLNYLILPYEIVQN